MVLGKLIGKGATAKVYEVSDNKVLKLYEKSVSLDQIKYEYDKMDIGYKNGISCPKVYEIIQLDGKTGYVMDRFNGLTISEKIMFDAQRLSSGEIEKEEFTNIFFNDIKGIAKALSDLHKITTTVWPNLKQNFLEETKTVAYLLESEKEKILSIINNLPEENCICHGDPNPNNILVDNGNYKFIDWVNSGIGNPKFDIAEYVLLNTPNENTNFEGIPKILIDSYQENKELIVPTFISEYSRVSQRDISDYDNYTIPLLIRKLHSNRTEKEKLIIVEDIRHRLTKY